MAAAHECLQLFVVGMQVRRCASTDKDRVARAASWRADTQLHESVECELMQCRSTCVATNTFASLVAAQAAPGEVVTLTGLPSDSSPPVPRGTANSTGDWSVSFNASSTMGSVGLTLTISGASGGTIVANNVMIGDVYICAGQVRVRLPSDTIMCI
jgi:hypothetical protein